MAKKNGDINISPPGANVSLDDLPVKQKDFQDDFEAWLLTRDREHLRRAEFRYIFLKAKDEGLASTGKLWGRQPVPKKAGPITKYKPADLALIPTLVGLMADHNIKLKTAIGMAGKQGLVEGVGTSGNKVERVARNLKDYRKDMEIEAQAR
jgi:hypothetical protein